MSLQFDRNTKDFWALFQDSSKIGIKMIGVIWGREQILQRKHRILLSRSLRPFALLPFLPEVLTAAIDRTQEGEATFMPH